MIKRFLLVCFLLVGCGDPSPSNSIKLEFRLPKSIKSPSSRWEKFRSRAEYLELKVQTRSGKTYENRFSPDSWGGVFLPNIEFPQGEQDQLELKVSIWDRRKDNSLRSFPVLEGKALVKASGMEREKNAEVVVLLHLNIEPENFDD